MADKLHVKIIQEIQLKNIVVRRSLAIPFLDHLKSDIESRFASHLLLAIKYLTIVPSCFEAAGVASDDEVLEFFSSDIEFKSTAKAELELW